MYRTAIILFFLLLSLTATAQEKYNAAIDNKTYELYMKSNWEELREAGAAAIDSGFDFYFLRMRLGISYYQDKNYMSAVPHFEKAVTFNPKDSIGLEYLYYSYLFSGQESEANILAKKLTAQLKRKIHYKEPDFFKGAYFEGGYSFNQDHKNITNNSILGSQSFSGTQNVFKGESYINLSLFHSIGDRISVFQGYNNIVVNSTQQFEDVVNKTMGFPASVKQNEYYINLGFYLGKGVNLTSAFHYLNVKIEESEPLLLTTQTSSSNDFAANLSLSKRIGHTELGFTTLFANMNSGKQNQNTFTFIWYPFGNLNFYNISGFTFHSNKKSDSSDVVTHFLFDEKLGFKVADKLWLEAVFTTGPVFNYSEGNAFIIYNNIDHIKYKAGFNIISPISEKIELSFRYLLLSQEYDVITTNSNLTDITKTNNFIIHKLIGGIKWTF
jgi:tetratricopeptide (TPR) repeat protein